MALEIRKEDITKHQSNKPLLRSISNVNSKRGNTLQYD
jgi:hypothetical protein